jgi:hypothetical protein
MLASCRADWLLLLLCLNGLLAVSVFMGLSRRFETQEQLTFAPSIRRHKPTETRRLPFVLPFASLASRLIEKNSISFCFLCFLFKKAKTEKETINQK